MLAAGAVLAQTPPIPTEHEDSAPAANAAPDFGSAQAARDVVQIPNGGANAATQGSFGPVVPWPIIGLHAILLPDGRVMSYGTDQQGRQGAELVYDVWTPSDGTGSNAHTMTTWR